MGEEYTCAMCGNTYEKCVPDDEALEELEEFFGNVPVDDCEIICDDCWEKTRPDKHGFSLPVSEKDVEARLLHPFPELLAKALSKTMTSVVQEIVNRDDIVVEFK